MKVIYIAWPAFNWYQIIISCVPELVISMNASIIGKLVIQLVFPLEITKSKRKGQPLFHSKGLIWTCCYVIFQMLVDDHSLFTNHDKQALHHRHQNEKDPKKGHDQASVRLEKDFATIIVQLDGFRELVKCLQTLAQRCAVRFLFHPLYPKLLFITNT